MRAWTNCKYMIFKNQFIPNKIFQSVACFYVFSPTGFTRTMTCPVVHDLLDNYFLQIFNSIYTQQKYFRA